MHSAKGQDKTEHEEIKVAQTLSFAIVFWLLIIIKQLQAKCKRHI